MAMLVGWPQPHAQSPGSVGVAPMAYARSTIGSNKLNPVCARDGVAKPYSYPRAAWSRRRAAAALGAAAPRGAGARGGAGARSRGAVGAAGGPQGGAHAEGVRAA